MLMGLCRLPLLHSDHCGFIKPQNEGPAIKRSTKVFHNAISIYFYFLFIYFFFRYGFRTIWKLAFQLRELVPRIIHENCTRVRPERTAGRNETVMITNVFGKYRSVWKYARTRISGKNTPGALFYPEILHPCITDPPEYLENAEAVPGETRSRESPRDEILIFSVCVRIVVSCVNRSEI